MAPEKSSGPTGLNMGRCNRKCSLPEIKRKKNSGKLISRFILYVVLVFLCDYPVVSRLELNFLELLHVLCA